MNKVELVGRLTRDPEVRYAEGGSSIARFGVAVDRRYKKEGGPTADFPNVVAFGRTAEFVEKYFIKGKQIGICGRLQTGSYDREDGTTVYTTDVVAEEVEFVGSKSDNEGQGSPATAKATIPVELPTDEHGFMNIPDGIDEELPFN